MFDISLDNLFGDVSMEKSSVITFVQLSSFDANDTIKHGASLILNYIQKFIVILDYYGENNIIDIADSDIYYYL